MCPCISGASAGDPNRSSDSSRIFTRELTGLFKTALPLLSWGPSSSSQTGRASVLESPTPCPPQVLNVVDGQQRLTSILLAFASLGRAAVNVISGIEADPAVSASPEGQWV